MNRMYICTSPYDHFTIFRLLERYALPIPYGVLYGSSMGLVFAGLSQNSGGWRHGIFLRRSGHCAEKNSQFKSQTIFRENFWGFHVFSPLFRIKEKHLSSTYVPSLYREDERKEICKHFSRENCHSWRKNNQFPATLLCQISGVGERKFRLDLDGGYS